MINYGSGDIFRQPAQYRVNPVNCEGVMGKGLALEFRRRYPKMFLTYKAKCNRSEVKIGEITTYKEKDCTVICFPTKYVWAEGSKYSWIADGLKTLAAFLKPLGAVTISVPALGCGLGGCEWGEVHKLIEEHLKGLDAIITVYLPY